MTLGGWITMCVSMGAFALLFIWCMYKTLSSDSSQRRHSRAKKRGRLEKN